MKQQKCLTLGTALIGMTLWAACGDEATPPVMTGAAGAQPTGTAGATAGMGAAGSMAPAGDFSCTGVDTTQAPSALHAGAAMVLLPSTTPNGTCAFMSCHNPGAKKAGLQLDATVTDLNAALVGKPACEAPSLSLIDGSTGDAALAKSWLWQKLVGPADSSGNITADPTWGTPGACGQATGSGYGVRMPLAGDDTKLGEAKLAPVKAWICAGAPKP